MKKENIQFIVVQFLLWTLYYFYNVKVVHGNIPPNNIILHIYLIFLVYFAVPLTLLLRWIYRKFNIHTLSYFKLSILILTCSVVLANLWYLEIFILDQLILKNTLDIVPYTWHYYFWEIFPATLLLVTWSGLYFFLKFWIEWKLQKEKTLNSQLMAQNAQLKMLQYQLNPHFLFNSLSSLRALINSDPKKADKMVSKISEFFKYPLINKDKLEVPLCDEIDAIKNYLNIEKIRFGDDLIFNINMDTMAEDYPIPVFLIQPLVENAVKFGMDTSPMPLNIEISAEVIENKLKINISNSGHWVDHKEGTKTGIDNVKKRLVQFYPSNYNFHINKNNGKVEVEIGLMKEIEFEKY